MIWLLIAFLTILAIEVVANVFYVRLILPSFEAEPPFHPAKFPLDPFVERVSTVTTDGLILRGSLHRGAEQSPRGLILFFPEFHGGHGSAAWYCEGLLQAGFDVLSFDFRGQGESDSDDDYAPSHWPTQFEMNDVRAAREFIRQRPDLRDLPLGLMGVSRGSLVALCAAAEFPQLQALCGDSTYTLQSLLEHFVLRWAQLYLPSWALRLIPMWHLRLTLFFVRWTSQWNRGVRFLWAERHLQELRNRPVLLISGERDNYVQPSIVRAIARGIGSPMTRIWSVPKAKHNQARLVATDDYDQTVAEFFTANFPAQAARPQSAPTSTVAL